MDNSSNFDDNSDVGYQPSPSSVDQNDHSITENVGYSPLFSGESFAYCRSNSEVSNFSEPIDDNSFASDQPSPSLWTTMKHGASQASLSRLGMKQHRNSLDEKSDDLDLLETGWFALTASEFFLGLNMFKVTDECLCCFEFLRH